MTDVKLSSKARASRLQLPREAQLELLDLLDKLSTSPEAGDLLSAGKVATRLYKHDEPPVEITYLHDKKHDTIEIVHFSIPLLRLVKNVFISYSHEDKRWLVLIRDELKPFETIGAVKIWADTDIKPGDLWEDHLSQHLRQARAAMLLVSESFLRSDYVQRKELPMILAAAEQERGTGVRLLWLAVGSCEWGEYPQGQAVARYQAMIDPKRPLGQLEDVSSALKQIRERFADAVAIGST